MWRVVLLTCFAKRMAIFVFDLAGFLQGPFIAEMKKSGGRCTTNPVLLKNKITGELVEIREEHIYAIGKRNIIQL